MEEAVTFDLQSIPFLEALTERLKVQADLLVTVRINNYLRIKDLREDEVEKKRVLVSANCALLEATIPPTVDLCERLLYAMNSTDDPELHFHEASSPLKATLRKIILALDTVGTGTKLEKQMLEKMWRDADYRGSVLRVLGMFDVLRDKLRHYLENNRNRLMRLSDPELLLASPKCLSLECVATMEIVKLTVTYMKTKAEALHHSLIHPRVNYSVPAQLRDDLSKVAEMAMNEIPNPQAKKLYRQIRRAEGWLR